MNCWPLGTGSPPIWPAGLTLFCACSAWNDLRDSDLQLGELIGIHPAAHGVLAGAEDVDLGHAGDAGEFVDQIDVCVIGEKDVVVAALGRIERDQHEGRRERFLNNQSSAASSSKWAGPSAYGHGSALARYSVSLCRWQARPKRDSPARFEAGSTALARREPDGECAGIWISRDHDAHFRRSVR